MSKVTDAMKQFYLCVKDECVISDELKNILISDEVKKVYHLAVECNDERAKSGFVQSETYNYDHGFMGKYYNFQELPEDIWITICAETKEYIQSKLDEIE